jgi:hypothetical protein
MGDQTAAKTRQPDRRLEWAKLAATVADAAARVLELILRR